jgi:hypothetical protein
VAQVSGPLSGTASAVGEVSSPIYLLSPLPTDIPCFQPLSAHSGLCYQLSEGGHDHSRESLHWDLMDLVLYHGKGGEGGCSQSDLSSLLIHTEEGGICLHQS